MGAQDNSAVVFICLIFMGQPCLHFRVFIVHTEGLVPNAEFGGGYGFVKRSDHEVSDLADGFICG